MVEADSVKWTGYERSVFWSDESDHLIVGSLRIPADAVAPTFVLGAVLSLCALAIVTAAVATVVTVIMP